MYWCDVHIYNVKHQKKLIINMWILLHQYYDAIYEYFHQFDKSDKTDKSDQSAYI